MLKPNIFREYDIRGIADTELPTDGVKLLGQAVGTYLIRRNSPRINLARDCRLSSDRLHDALLAGLLAAGCGVTDLGVVPTPLLYYSVFHLQAGGGVMITGSHNPADYNGFKVMHGKSTIHGEEIQKILGLIQRGDFETGEGSVRCVDVVTPYVDEIAAQFKLPRRVRVVSDAGNGTAGPVFRRILEKLNCDSTELFFDMDGRFPNHHPDPTQPENLAHLVAAVLANQADVGLAFDGDSDRIGAVDERGTILYGDQLMIVYAREILSRKPGATIIGEVKSSQNMYDDIRRHGGNPIMWKTGHSLIKARMQETRAELAGEMSGHMFFADRYYGFDDALYAACRLLEIVSNSATPLSAQLSDLPAVQSTPEIRVDCPDDRKFGVVKAVRERFQRDYDVIDIDGARIDFGQGWGLIRASNTQPVLVLRFEAQSIELLNQYRKQVEDAVAEASGNAATSRVSSGHDQRG
jgi:phosphomannomutase/phosphoglucomutase